MPLDRKAISARARGLAAPAIAKHLLPGAVFSAKDDLVVLPEERLDGAGDRTMHVTRRVILLQSRELSMAQAPKTILVVPCSASSFVAGSWDFQIPDGEPGFDKTGVVAFTSLVQPLLKADLVTFLGQLRDETLLAMQQVVARNMGILPAHTIPLPAVVDSTRSAGSIAQPPAAGPEPTA